MKIYLAGTTVCSVDCEIAQEIQKLFASGNKLHSYYHSQENGFEHNWFKKNMENKTDIFLDSGAFSAFTQGVPIDINEYISFIKEHQKHLTVYANLDVIGSAEGTWKNQRRIERAGLNPLPCFHYGEDLKWLKKYLDKGYDYIALGGMVPISTKDLKIWLDEIWSNYLTDKDGMPVVKVHGFGLTSFPLMKRYPWYSVDSTSWVMTGRMGGIMVPKFRNGKYDYESDAWKIQLSSRSPTKNEAGKHLESMPPMAREQIVKYIASKGFKLGTSSFKTESVDYELKENEKWAGKEVDGKRDVEVIIENGLCNDYRERDRLNIMYYLDLESNWQKWPWSFRIQKTRGFM